MAYLTHSQYGRNRNEVTVNNVWGLTGNAGNSVEAGVSGSIENAYNTTAGMLASTTGNIYGVYDMNGGMWEYTASWNSSSNNEKLTNNGKDLEDNVYFNNGEISDRMKMSYNNKTDVSSGMGVKAVCKIGDGIKETWVNDDVAWLDDSLGYVTMTNPFFARGGFYNPRLGRRCIYELQLRGKCY